MTGTSTPTGVRISDLSDPGGTIVKAGSDLPGTTPHDLCGDAGPIARAAPDRKIHWRCFHCDAAFTKAQRRHAEAHFGSEETALPVCQLRLPGEHHLLNILRKQEEELRAFYAEDTELWRALYAQAADHAAALRSEEERGYAKGVADARAHSSPLQAMPPIRDEKP